MLTEEQQAAFDEWLSDRPEEVQALARKYPPGTKFRIHNRVMHVVSYQEYDNSGPGVVVSPIDPAVNYQRSIEARMPVCPCCEHNLEQARIE